MRIASPFSLLFMLALACEGGQVSLVNPEKPEDPNRPLLEIRVTVDPEDAEMGQALGWTEGIPGALVQYARVEDHTYSWDTIWTDGNGRVTIDEPGAGLYWIAAERQMTAAEASSLSVRPRAIGVFAGGETVNVSRTDGASVVLPTKLDRPGSLVFSEVFLSLPLPWETGGSYYGSKYFELYNNSDEVVYLDGMVLGWGYEHWFDFGAYGHHTCESTRPMRLDPDAIWSKNAWQFPGTGREYPVTPGQAVLVAVQAQDHSGVHPSLLNLIEADFEIGDPSWADNPAAPNLVDVGPSPLGAGQGQGLSIAFAFHFLSSAVEVNGLETRGDLGLPQADIPYRAYPAMGILDGQAIWWDTSREADPVADLPLCQNPVLPDIDRIPGGFIESELHDVDVSASRRVLPLLDGTGLALLDTGVSRVDFVRSVRTPGWIK